MSKFSSVSKGQVAIFSTLFVLILLGVGYFFIYVPKNEKTVQARHFLSLQTIQQNVHLKIENSLSQLKALDTAYSDPKQKESVENYIKKYPKDNFTLLKKTTPEELATINKLKNRDSSYIDVNTDSKRLTLYLAKNVNKNLLGIQYKVEQFIKPLLPADAFDQYVVFITDASKKNEVLYETFASGLSIKGTDSLLQKKSGITSPGIYNLTIGGTDYKVFSQPVRIDENRQIVVSGLVSYENYRKEKDQLPVGIVLLLLTAATGMIVSLPWIKLYHMGSKDKLTVSDGVSTLLVSMLMMSLLFFIIFNYSFKHIGNSSRFATWNDTLANKITKSFENDLDTAYCLLVDYDNYHTYLKNNITNLGKSNAMHQIAPDNSKFEPLPNEYHYLKIPLSKNIAVSQVFWLDSTGMEKDNWIAANINAPHTNFGWRDYFKNTKKNMPNKTGGQSYYVDQVVSRVSGVFTSVIAKKSIARDTEIAAISFTAKSLDSVIIPDGYQYAIINTKGDVLYHYIKDRNLNENLAKELSDSSELVSSLQAKANTSFDAKYYGKQYHIKIKPFADLPYFIVIFEDLEYNDARDAEPYAFTVSMLICFLIFMIIQITVIFLVSSRRSFFKKQLFETSWIGPKTTSIKEYNLAIVGNGIVIILLAVFFRRSSFLEYFYILLFSITFISILLNFIFALSYKAQNNYYYKFKATAIRWLSVFVLIIDLAAWQTLDSSNRWHLFLFEVLSVILCSAVCFAEYYIPNLTDKLSLVKSWLSSNSYFRKWTYTNSFALMGTTRLIVSSGIPVAFFFIYSFSYEQSLETRYRQMNFANALTQKINTHTDKIDTDLIRKELQFTSGIYNDGLFIKDFGLYTADQKSASKVGPLPYSMEDRITVDMLSAFRVFKNSIALRSNDMNLPAEDSTAFFNKLTLKCISNDTTFTYYNIGKGNYIILSSRVVNYTRIRIRLWGLLIISIAVFYFIVHNIIRKLFALNLPSTSRWHLMDEKLIFNNKLNALLFILGSPGSGKLDKLKKKLKNNGLEDLQEKELLDLEDRGELKERDEKYNIYKEKKLLGNRGELLIYSEKDKSKNNVFVADMINISAEHGEDDPAWQACRNEALRDRYSLIIINHFEYNIKDPKTNSIKLDFLESLMLKGASKIAIISTVHPLTFLDSFNDQQMDDNQKSGIPESELERWHVLLGHFRIAIEPLSDISKTDDYEVTLENDSDAPLKRAIFDETRYSHYLNNMQQLAINTTPFAGLETVDDVSDSLIFKLQITSHYFYTYIWQSLTKEEKFLLYDLAEDGLVNPSDDYNLSLLVCKGLIIRPCGTLMLFNKGFRNFILTAIGNTEVNRIKNQVKDTGNWGSLKAPLILAILAIFVFLMASQQEAYTQIITYITAIGAGVPAILKIFSLFPNNSQKSQ